jgi:uncharacterized RDD family membrane protein YckC
LATPGPVAVVCRKCAREFTARPEAIKAVELAATSRWQPRPAGAGWRILAALTNNLLWGLPAIVLILLMVANVIPRPDREQLELMGILFLVWFFVIAGYQVVLLTVAGQSIGKRLFGLRIVRFEDGGKPGFLRAVVLRAVLGSLIYSLPGGVAGELLHLDHEGVMTPLIYALPVVGLLMLVVSFIGLFDPSGRTLHDRLAGTTVENER